MYIHVPDGAYAIRFTDMGQCIGFVFGHGCGFVVYFMSQDHPGKARAHCLIRKGSPMGLCSFLYPADIDHVIHMTQIVYVTFPDLQYPSEPSCHPIFSCIIVSHTFSLKNSHATNR